MPRKLYHLSGNSFTTTEKELTVTFANPRELQQVTVTHAAFTLDLGGPDPPPQLYLRSTALGAATHSRARTVTAAGKEEMSDVLGHVSLVQAHDLSSTGHFELTRPVAVNFGTFKGKMPTMDFFLTDHTGARVNFLFQVISSIDRYQWEGEYTLNPTGNTVNISNMWGPNENEYVGGDLDYPMVNSTWTYRYNTSVFVLKWENDNAKKINGVWDVASQAFTWTDGDPEGWGLLVGDPLLTFNDWTNHGIEIPIINEVTEQHPYASMALSVDAAH